jgi:endonuclease YncB( thermonuclease family)
MTYKGLAWHYERYSDNCPTKELIAMGERVAQKEEFNIWSLPSPVAPWDWRRANR